VERVAIDEVPLGGRVQTRNPRRWEYDDSLPEPDEASWAKLSITVQRSDGGVVDAELLRPRAWIELHGIVAGQLLPLHLPELEVSGQALVTAVEACPPIAGGEGSVVTARFVTREVHVVASVEVLDPDGSIETITGTTIHPVWSVDREDWVPLGELVQGETLQGQSGVAVVLSVTLSRVAQPVYNLEVHGEHVYQVGELGVLVHNAGEECELLRNAPKGGLRARMGDPPSGMLRPQAHHDLPQAPRFKPHWDRAGLDIDDPAFGRWVEGGPVGDHQKWSAEFNQEWDDFFRRFPEASREQILEQMNRLRGDPRFQ
jgi:hypothetical protein